MASNVFILEGCDWFVFDWLHCNKEKFILCNEEDLTPINEQHQNYSPLHNSKSLLLYDPSIYCVEKLFTQDFFQNIYLYYNESFPDFRNKYLNQIKKQDRYYLFEYIRPYEINKIKLFLSKHGITDASDIKYFCESPPLITTKVRVDGDKKEVNVVDLYAIINFQTMKDIQHIYAKDFFDHTSFELWGFLEGLINQNPQIYAPNILKINTELFEKCFNVIKSQLDIYIALKLHQNSSFNNFLIYCKEYNLNFNVSPQRYGFLKQQINCIALDHLISLQANVVQAINDSRSGYNLSSVLLGFVYSLLQSKDF